MICKKVVSKGWCKESNIFLTSKTQYFAPNISFVSVVKLLHCDQSQTTLLVAGGISQNILMVFFSSGSQCWYFSHEPSSLFHHCVLVDLSVSVMMH